MTNDEIRDVILTGIAQDVEYWPSDERQPLMWAHQNRQGQLLRQKVSNAAEGIVPYKPSDWLGRPLTGSERTRFSRVLRQLEAEGEVECYADSRGRATHVALVEVGNSFESRVASR